MKLPDASDWMVLLAVACMAAMVSGLSSYQSSRRSSDRMLLFAVKALTAFFVTLVTYLVLHSLAPLILLAMAQWWPGLNGAAIPGYGIAGMAGIVGHLGLKKTISSVTKIIDRH